MNQAKEELRKDPNPEPFGPVIYSYSRAQAIEDGVLVDVTERAKEAGFKWPFAMTAEVWQLIEQIPPNYSHEDIEGRLWDVLMVARYRIAKAGKGEDSVFFEPILHHNGGDKVKLKLQVGPGDDSNPVLTLMLPWQD